MEYILTQFEYDSLKNKNSSTISLERKYLKEKFTLYSATEKGELVMGSGPTEKKVKNPTVLIKLLYVKDGHTIELYLDEPDLRELIDDIEYQKNIII